MDCYSFVGRVLALIHAARIEIFIRAPFHLSAGADQKMVGSLAGRVYGGSVEDRFHFLESTTVRISNAWHPVSTCLALGQKIIQAILSYDLCLPAFYLLLYMNKQKAKSAIAQ